MIFMEGTKKMILKPHKVETELPVSDRNNKGFKAVIKTVQLESVNSLSEIKALISYSVIKKLINLTRLPIICPLMKLFPSKFSRDKRTKMRKIQIC